MNYKFVLCILVRFMISYLTYKFQNNNIIPTLTLIQSLSFFYLFLFDLRLMALEASGVTWWNIYRPIHGVMFLLFTLYYLKKYKYAWTFLFSDTILGIIFYMIHYYIKI